MTNTFQAWFRAGHRVPWRKIGPACSTEDAAWTIALDHGGPGDKTVLPEGRDPNGSRRTQGELFPTHQGFNPERL